MVDEMIAKRLLEAFRRAGGLFFFFFGMKVTQNWFRLFIRRKLNSSILQVD